MLSRIFEPCFVNFHWNGKLLKVVFPEKHDVIGQENVFVPTFIITLRSCRFLCNFAGILSRIMAPTIAQRRLSSNGVTKGIFYICYNCFIFTIFDHHECHVWVY